MESSRGIAMACTESRVAMQTCMESPLFRGVVSIFTNPQLSINPNALQRSSQLWEEGTEESRVGIETGCKGPGVVWYGLQRRGSEIGKGCKLESRVAKERTKFTGERRCTA
jgi:hypothetical protein